MPPKTAGHGRRAGIFAGKSDLKSPIFFDGKPDFKSKRKRKRLKLSPVCKPADDRSSVGGNDRFFHLKLALAQVAVNGVSGIGVVDWPRKRTAFKFKFAVV